MKRWLSHLVLVGLIAGCLSAATPVNVQRMPLTGLTEISVVVEAIPPALEKAIDQQQLQASVELRLRRAGIRVVEADFKAAKPYLYVNLNAIQAPKLPVIACAITIKCNQESLLVRDPSIKLYFDTWQSALIVTVGEAQVREIDDAVLRQVDIFANDFLAANEKGISNQKGVSP